MNLLSDKIIPRQIAAAGLFLFCLWIPIRSLGQTTFKEQIILTPDSVRRTAAASTAISTAAANIPVQYVAHYSGKFKLIFEEGQRKTNPFNKKSSLTITVADSTGKQKYEGEYYPGDYFPSYITGDLSPDCPDTWYLYGKGPFEWDSGATGKAIDDDVIYSCTSEQAQELNGCQTTNYGNIPYLDITSWTLFDGTAVTRSYLRFNGFHFSRQARLDTAILSLYTYGLPWYFLGSDAFTVSTVAGAWDENTLNWQNRPGAGSPSVAVPAGNSDVHLNVMSIVRGWVANPGSNYGFRLALQNEQPYHHRLFWSSEGSIPPHLMATVSNPAATIDTLTVSAVAKGDKITLDYAGNGNVYSTSTDSSLQINGKQVSGQQFEFNVAGPSCGNNYSEQVKTFGWVDKSPSDEILLGQTKYYAAVKDPNSHTGKIDVKEVPVDSQGKPMPPAGIITGAFKGNPIHILSGGDTSGVYWDRKWENIKSDGTDNVYNLPEGIIRVIGRYWQTGKKYKVKIMPTNSMPSDGITITVIKPSRLGNSYSESRDVYGHSFSIDSLIIVNAGKYGIPPELIKAQMNVEAAKVGGEFTPSYRYEPYKYIKPRLINILEGMSGRFFIKDSSSSYFSDIPMHQNVHYMDYFRKSETIWNIVKKHSQLVNASASDTYGKRLADGKMDYKDLGYVSIQKIYNSIYNNIATNTNLQNWTESEIADSARKGMIVYLRDEWEGGFKYIMAQTRVGSSYGMLQMMYATARGNSHYTLYSVNKIPENMNTNAFFVKTIQYQYYLINKYLTRIYTNLNDNWPKGYFNTFVEEIYPFWNNKKPKDYGMIIMQRSKYYIPIK